MSFPFLLAVACRGVIGALESCQLGWRWKTQVLAINPTIKLRDQFAKFCSGHVVSSLVDAPTMPKHPHNVNNNYLLTSHFLS